MAVQLKRYKKEFNYSYTLGVYPTIELLRLQIYNVQKVFLHTKGNKNKGIIEIQNICREKNIPIETNDTFIEKIAAKGNCYAIGIFKKYKSKLYEKQNHVVLINPSDGGNLGTIIRTMVGFGFYNLAVILPSVDIFDPKVIRASMGSIFQINFEYFDNFDNYQNHFHQNLYPFMTNGKENLATVLFKKPFAFIFGNESNGLPKEFLHKGTSVYIAQSKNIDSLNLSIAIGIVLYICSVK